MNIDAIVADVPDYKVFLTIDELDASSAQLAEKYPDIARLWQVGVSRAGAPMRALVIGDGPRRAFLFGLPHPNEPIGAMMCEYLARRLCADDDLRNELGFTWIILKAADPDGTRLNEGWFRGPFTIDQYARNFYRPPSHEQVEWTFPISYKRLNFDQPLPETRALMRIIDDMRPDFMFSLHNAGFGGVYWYLSHAAPGLYDAFRSAATAQALPLSLGEPEMPYAVTLSEAIYRMPTLRDSYDYLEANGQDPLKSRSGGTSSADYAEGRGYPTRTLVCEMPYFYDPRIEDTRPADITRQRAVIAATEWAVRHLGEVEEVLAAVGDRTGDSPFGRAVENFIQHGRPSAVAERHWAETNLDPKVPATVAQAFDSAVVSRFYRLLTLGMLVRMVPAGDPARPRAEALFERNLSELRTALPNYQTIPIRKLVAVQLASALHMARYVATGGER